MSSFFIHLDHYRLDPKILKWRRLLSLFLFLLLTFFFFFSHVSRPPFSRHLAIFIYIFLYLFLYLFIYLLSYLFTYLHIYSFIFKPAARFRSLIWITSWTCAMHESCHSFSKLNHCFDLYLDSYFLRWSKCPLLPVPAIVLFFICFSHSLCSIDLFFFSISSRWLFLGFSHLLWSIGFFFCVCVCVVLFSERWNKPWKRH